MKYYSCMLLERCYLNFNGRIDVDNRKHMTFCCEVLGDVPGAALAGSPEESIKNFFKVRKSFIEESKKISLFGTQLAGESANLTDKCKKCAHFKMMDWGKSEALINYINLSTYPAPCQCKCMYCGIAQNSELRIYQAQKHQLYYEKVFDVLEYAKNKNLISPEALWQISSGEITIHPFKERIFNLVRYKHVHFYTNCFIFDEEIAQILKSNPYAAINLSIDSGTSQTWKKIKGVDNFAVVTENLVKYFTSSSRPGQITLKYIILPGINDTADDFTFVVEIMKILKTGHLTLSRDTGIKYFLGDEESEKLVKSAGRLVSLLQKNGLSFDMFTYLPEERENIIAYAKETV